MTYICVGNLAIIGSDNGLSPGRRQAIIWTNAGILSIGPLGTNFSEILIKIDTLSFKKMYLKISSGKWRPCCLGLDVFNNAFSSIFQHRWLHDQNQRYRGPVSISHTTSYGKISQILETAKFVFRIVRSLWNSAGTSATLLSRCLLNVNAMQKI